MLKLKLSNYLVDRKQAGLYRQRQVLDVTEKGLNFSSNDYLSLTNDARVKCAYQQGVKRYPTGSRGSMVVCGYHSIHRDLERAFADALNVDDCILFTSGYVANLSVLQLLAQFASSILIDKAVHASIYDGLAYSRLPYTRFHHQSLADLSSKLLAMPNDSVMLTESIFSMSGQVSALDDIVQLLQPKQCDLLVDEAHAFGIFGKEGLGAVAHFNLTQHDVPLRIIPLGKAFGACGAIVAGQGAWIESLLQCARPYIYSTGISPAVAYGLLETLPIVRQADDRRVKLNALVQYFRAAIMQSSFTFRDSITPIQQLQLGCPHKATLLAEQLRARSIHCLPMRQPTVSKQETGLRIVLNYHHEVEDIDYFFEALRLFCMRNR